MLNALCDHLTGKPSLYVEEMAIFLWDEFNIFPSSSSIKRGLSHAGWTKKKALQKAKEQNSQPRDFYCNFLCRGKQAAQSESRSTRDTDI
jgi:hypothetical protein